MKPILNITNGDSAVKTMREAGIPGIYLPWRDVLHEGPVPAGLSLEELSQIRAQFIANRGWADRDVVAKDFAERDNTLVNYADYSRVVLWFEHDLYDQLQLLQLLDWFAQHYQGEVPLKLINVDQYLGVVSVNHMQHFMSLARDVTDTHLNLARKAWAAYRSASPEAWQALLNEDTTPLRFLHDAVYRQLEEYPNSRNGLSRTAQQALRIISEGESRPGRVFGAYQETEEKRFMGDASFWQILHEFLDSSPPLLKLPEGKKLTLPTSPDQTLSITLDGINVLLGRHNWLDIMSIDRWIGGVHLTPQHCWCWNPVTAQVELRSG